jgi:MFS family permease
VNANSVWENKKFKQIWISYSLSEFGQRFVLALAPLVSAEVLHASPFQMGVIATAPTIPYLLFGTAVGLISDRFRKLTIMVTADAFRALFAAVVGIAIYYWFLDFELFSCWCFLLVRERYVMMLRMERFCLWWSSVNY